MSISVTKDSTAIKKESSKLIKVFKAVKKFLAKEFLWILFVFLLALPIGFIISFVVKGYINSSQLSPLDSETSEALFIASYVIGMAGIYFARFVVGAIKTLTAKPEES